MKDVLVDEGVVPDAEVFVPDFGTGGILHVVVSRDVEEGHFKWFKERVELLPFFPEFLLRVAARDEIAHGDDELGLQFVEFPDRTGKDTRDAAAAISENRELKVVGIVFEVLVCPRLLLRRYGMGEIGVILRAGEGKQGNDKGESGEMTNHGLF